MANTTITAPEGFKVAVVKAGIKESGNLDLGLIVADKPVRTAAVFTTNKVVAPAIVVNRDHLRNGKAQAVYVNAGNANTCTGKRGMRDVERICREVAVAVAVASENVMVCSTGIIGHYLPMEKVRAGIQNASGSLSRTVKSGCDFAQAIMTTDLKIKMSYQEISIGGRRIKIAGAAKGSGMIAPNMATMLAFITTDAAVGGKQLNKALKDVVSQTFNKVSIDNHQSTSDTAIVMASGYAENRPINMYDRDYQIFCQGLWQVCDDLARQMAADGEGATRSMKLCVTGAATVREAHKAVRALSDSPLVRTAFHGADPNWGRIISAIGNSGANFDPEKLSCKIVDTFVYRRGMPAKFNAVVLSKKMKAKYWEVHVDLGVGQQDDFCYTCDLTRGYIAINADYHT